MAGLCRNYNKFSFLKGIRLHAAFGRFKSDAHIAMTDDSSTIVCWHPETQFPYEKTLPIPEKQVIKSDSVLKVQSSKEFLQVLKPKSEDVVREELMKLTFTTKHIWFPPKFRFRRKEKPAPDRPYL